jgi:FkbM family methyltransferase
MMTRARDAVSRIAALTRISASPVRTVALYGMAKVSDRARGQPCRFVANGVTLLARPQDWLALDEVFSAREYGFVQELLAGVSAPVVVDLGANIGAFSAYLLGEYSGALVHSVEASPDTAALLHRNRELNPSLRWQTHHCAVWIHDEVVAFESGGASTGRRIAAHGNGVEVPARTIPTLLEEWNLTNTRIDLVKIDIEGAEGPVLANASAWLARVQHLIVEVHPPTAVLEQVLARLTGAFTTVRQIPRGSAKPLLVASR